MNTADEYERAQRIMDDADSETADLIEDLWNELVQREHGDKNYSRITEYWKTRCEAAEERLRRASVAVLLEDNLSGGEERIQQRIRDALISKINDYAEPVWDPVDAILMAVRDRYMNLPMKIRMLLQEVQPAELVEELIEEGWVRNKELEEHFKSETIVLVSMGGTQMAVPMDSDKEDYEKRMFRALDQYGKYLQELLHKK